MKTETDIQDRIRYLLMREMDRRISQVKKRLPVNCTYNHRQGEGADSIGLCMLGVANPEHEWGGTICEHPEDAQTCPYFNTKHTLGAVREEFDLQLRDLSWVAQNMPEVHELLWVLGADHLPKLPWWKALWYRFIGVRPDSLVRRKLPLLPTGDA